jgi:hypothetical protein
MSNTLSQPLTAAGVLPNTDPGAEQLETILKQVVTLRFGVIQIVVHDGRIVQIDRTEKFRIDPLQGR